MRRLETSVNRWKILGAGAVLSTIVIAAATIAPGHSESPWVDAQGIRIRDAGGAVRISLSVGSRGESRIDLYDRHGNSGPDGSARAPMLTLSAADVGSVLSLGTRSGSRELVLNA
jgi:hypothetical protein